MFAGKHRNKKRNKEKKAWLCIGYIFFSPKVNLALKKKILEKHWLFIQITDEPLVKIHLGLRLRTRMCSWSVEEGCVFTRGGLGEKGWGSKGSCQNSHRDKNQKKNVEKQLAKLMTTVLSKSWQGRAFFCLLEMIALKVFFFFFF